MKILLALTCIIAVIGCAPETAIAKPPVAFVGVSVVSVEDGGQILRDQTVLIEGDRITMVGPTAAVTFSSDTVQINGDGRYLMPGLAEMHAHIPSPNSGWDVEDILFLYVSQGVTTARGMQGGAGQLALREKASKGEITSPTLYLAAPSMSGSSVKSVAAAKDRVAKAKAEGWDLLKVHEGLSVEIYDAIADYANAAGIPFGGHVADAVGLEHALKKGQRTVDHLDNYLEFMDAVETPATDDGLARAAELTVETRAGVVPTMALWEYFTKDPADLSGFEELRYVPQRTVSGWADRLGRIRAGDDTSDEINAIYFENRRKLLKALADGGAEVLLGSDAPQIFSVPGFSIHREMQAMAAAGMTPLQILQSGTAAVGAYFEDKDKFGAITPGDRADLVLVSANPLEAIENAKEIEGVMVRGQWLDRQTIDVRLTEMANRYAR